MYKSPGIDQRLLGEDARKSLLGRANVITDDDIGPAKQVAVIERNKCGQGCCRRCGSEDRTVFLMLLGVVLLSSSYFFLRTHKHDIKPIL